MSEEIKDQQNKEKEIDLLSILGNIFSAIGRGIMAVAGWIKTTLLWFFGFFKKHFWVLFALLVVGAAAGYMKARLQKPYYETEMLVETQIIPRAQIADRINSLQNMIDDKNDALANILNLPIDEVHDVFYINADIVNVKVELPADYKEKVRKKKKGSEEEEEEEIEKAEELGPQFIRITVRLWDNENINRLEEALVEFVENDPYTQERLNIIRTHNQMERMAILAEIEQLSLFQKKNIEKSSAIMTAGNSPLLVQNEEKTYVAEILALKNNLLALERDSILTKPISVIQPFVPYQNPVDRTLANMVGFALLFFGIGYGLLFIRENWSKI